MFNITNTAHQFLSEVIEKEKQYDEEELYVRLTMGIG
jgi:hypothetical protein